MARCSICGTLIQEADAAMSCPECQQQYHQGCWDEIGGCATYGCTSAAAAEKPPPPVVVGAGWGDTKRCPSCGCDIASSLLVCRPCGARFPWADPMTHEEWSAWTAREQTIASSRKMLVALFIFSIIGFTAPLCGPAAGVLAYRKRRELEGSNGTYLALGYGSAALGGAYAFLLLLLALGH